MDSWFSDIQEQAKVALEKTVNSIDKVLDIKEPAAIVGTPEAKLNKHRQQAAERRAKTEVELAASLAKTPLKRTPSFSTPIRKEEKKEESNFFDSFIGSVTETKNQVTSSATALLSAKKKSSSSSSNGVATTKSTAAVKSTNVVSQTKEEDDDKDRDDASSPVATTTDSTSEPNKDSLTESKTENVTNTISSEKAGKIIATEEAASGTNGNRGKASVITDDPPVCNDDIKVEGVDEKDTNEVVVAFTERDDETKDLCVIDNGGEEKLSTDIELEGESDRAHSDDHTAKTVAPVVTAEVAETESAPENAQEGEGKEEDVEGKASMATAYAQKCATLAMTLQAREEQIMKLTHQLDEVRGDNLHLQEEIGRFQNADGKTPKQQLDALTAEFTARLGELQKKLTDSNSEREVLRKQVREITERYEADTTESESLTAQLINEKDEQIEKLIKEGKKLSEKQFKSATINKNLQAKIKESDANMATLTQRLQAADARIQALEGDIQKRTSDEIKIQQSALEVSAVAENQSKELKAARDELTKLREENSGIKSTLDKLYKSLSDLERSKKEAEARAAEATMAAELTAQDKYHGEMGKLRQEHEHAEEQLRTQISDLQQSLSRAEALVQRKEENHRQELKHWEGRLKDSEAHGQDLALNISQATKPLLRQIENLQQASSAQVDAWEVAEANLNNQIEALQSAGASAEEKAREAEAHAAEERVRSATLEEKCAAAKRQLLRLTSDLEALTRSKESLSTEVMQLRAAADRAQENAAQKEQDFKQRFIHAQTQHQDEIQALKKQYEDALTNLRGEMAKYTSESSRKPPTEKERQETPYLPQSTSGNHATSATVERLQNLLKLKEQEITSIRGQKDSLEQSRDAIAEELVTLVSQNEALSSKISGADEMKQHADEVEGRYNHLLQMYGEKVEEVQELRLDLQDVKAMMRTQTQQLVSQIEQLSSEQPT